MKNKKKLFRSFCVAKPRARAHHYFFVHRLVALSPILFFSLSTVRPTFPLRQPKVFKSAFFLHVRHVCRTYTNAQFVVRRFRRRLFFRSHVWNVAFWPFFIASPLASKHLDPSIRPVAIFCTFYIFRAVGMYIYIHSCSAM